MASEGTVQVEVVYALTDDQYTASLTVPYGATVADALQLSGFESRFPELGDAQVGIYGRVVPRQTVLENGDRVEVYRPLTADPKAARRRRAGRAR